MSLPAVVLSPSEISYIQTSLAHPTTPTRLDARSPLASRPISISYGVYPHANGSARVNVGGTEVVAGVRLEVVDVGKGEKKGSEGWRGKVEVDVLPHHADLIPLVQLDLPLLPTLVPLHPLSPPLPIIQGSKYFQPHIHLTLLSSAGNVPSALIMAARAAFGDLKVPKTKVISWVGESDSGVEGTGGAGEGGVGKGDLSGIKAAIQGGKGKGKGKYIARGGEDWDLDLEGDGVEFMDGRDGLPVLVTLNMVPNSPNIFIDATPQEESACPSRLHVFFSSSSSTELKVCGAAGIAQELAQELNKSLPI